MTQPQIFRTPFREHFGGYETAKARALEKHLRTLAEAVSHSATIQPCTSSKHDQPPWLKLQEYENPTADYNSRSGEWISELTLEPLP